jgi:hypothetical protein
MMGQVFNMILIHLRRRNQNLSKWRKLTPNQAGCL